MIDNMSCSTFSWFLVCLAFPDRCSKWPLLPNKKMPEESWHCPIFSWRAASQILNNNLITSRICGSYIPSATPFMPASLFLYNFQSTSCLATLYIISTCKFWRNHIFHSEWTTKCIGWCIQVHLGRSGEIVTWVTTIKNICPIKTTGAITNATGARFLSACVWGTPAETKT